MRLNALLAVCVCWASPSFADVQVRFDEGAPKDHFTISNIDGCSLGATAITIDLRGSPYGLIFDVTGRGAGVEVFQPFELSQGGENLKALPEVLDGDNQLTLDLNGLAAGASISFTIDVDDTANNREITVSGAEIMGAGVVVRTQVSSSTASFNEDAIANVVMSSCTS
ncbi:MAG: aggregation factor core [Pseudomonadota bacterium]